MPSWENPGWTTRHREPAALNRGRSNDFQCTLHLVEGMIDCLTAAMARPKVKGMSEIRVAIDPEMGSQRMRAVA